MAPKALSCVRECDYLRDYSSASCCHMVLLTRDNVLVVGSLVIPVVFIDHMGGGPTFRLMIIG